MSGNIHSSQHSVSHLGNHCSHYSLFAAPVIPGLWPLALLTFSFSFSPLTGDSGMGGLTFLSLHPMPSGWSITLCGRWLIPSSSAGPLLRGPLIITLYTFYTFHFFHTNYHSISLSLHPCHSHFLTCFPISFYPLTFQPNYCLNLQFFHIFHF